MFLVFYFSYINLDVIIPSKIKIQILCQILYFISFYNIVFIYYYYYYFICFYVLYFTH